MSPDALADKQNPDGGWPYGRGSSWTEPTAYAVLAMLAAGEKARARKAIAWLKCLERSDGGWRPRPGVEESTWVTALAALVPREEFGRAAHDRAVGWLIDAAGAESGAISPDPSERLQYRHKTASKRTGSAQNGQALYPSSMTHLQNIFPSLKK